MKRAKTPTFLLELPLRVDWSQERHLRAHLEAARCLYNALLAEATKRLHRMRNDPAWKKLAPSPAHTNRNAHRPSLPCARSITSRNTNCMNMPKLPASRGSPTISRVRWRKPWRRVPIKRPVAWPWAKPNGCAFRSQGRGIDSVEGKRNDVGLRFVLDPNAGDGGFLIWNERGDPRLIDWRDPVVQHGLRHTIKYVRLIRRKASSPQAQGADRDGNRYFVQLILEGHAFTKKKHEQTGTETVGLDIGPSTLAIVPREGAADLVTFCEELAPNACRKRRLQRKMERQRRANNPENYDEKGRVKKQASPFALAREQAVQSNQTTACKHREETGCPPQEPAWASWPTRSSSWATPSTSRKPHSKPGRNSMVEASDFAHQGCL